ncbi:hypothetical protein NDU88_004316, partial [Pleurodeles waltl]
RPKPMSGTEVVSLITGTLMSSDVELDLSLSQSSTQSLLETQASEQQQPHPAIAVPPE